MFLLFRNSSLGSLWKTDSTYSLSGIQIFKAFSFCFSSYLVSKNLHFWQIENNNQSLDLDVKQAQGERKKGEEMQNNHINENNQVLDCNMKTGETAVLTHKLYTMVARGTILVHFLVLKNVPCNVCVSFLFFLKISSKLVSSSLFTS